MKFSELLAKSDTKHGELVRDGEFQLFSILQSRLPQSAVFVKSGEFLKRALSNQNISLILCPEGLVGDIPEEVAVFSSSNPELAFYDLRATFLEMQPAPAKTKIAASARVHPSASIAETGVIIAEDVIIDENAVIRSGTEIGRGSRIQAGCVVSSTGLMVSRASGSTQVIKHEGKVCIGEGAELQAGCSINAGLFGWNTTIEDGAVLDSHVHLSHGVRIGRNAIIAANCVISGFTQLGENVYVGPNSSLAQHLVVGSGARITMGSTVVGNVSEGRTVTGYFASDHGQFLAEKAAVMRLRRR